MSIKSQFSRHPIAGTAISLVAGATALFAALTFRSLLPDIVRYLRLRRM